MFNQKNDLIEIERIEILDLWDITIKMREFYRLLDYPEFEEEVRMRLIKARGYLDSARSLLKNMIMPEENEYIKKHENSYKWMIDNLNRADLFLDDLQNDAIDEVDKLSNINKFVNETTKFAKASEFEKSLYEYMEHLVYYPIKLAYKKFLKYPHEIEKDDKIFKVIKDEKLFIYLIFLEIFHASEVLGGIARQQIKYSPKGFGTVNLKSSSEIPYPSRLPDNLETEEIEIPNELKDLEEADVGYI